MNLKKCISLVFAIVVMAVLAACAGGGAPAGGGGAEAPAAGGGGGGAAAPAPGAAAADPAATEGRNTVVMAVAAEPTLFMPFHSTNMDHVPVLHNIYETVIRLTADGVHEPMLAHSWTISPDGLLYTFYLRDDVYFHNGDKMTADDFAWTLNYIGPTPIGAQLLGNFDYAEAIDDYTFTVRLTAPNSAFLNGMAARFALVVNRRLYEEIGIDAYNDNPIGTGPFMFVERIPGDRVVLRANPNHWNGPPAIEYVIIRVMSDANTQMIALESGDIDVLIRANVSMLTRMTAPDVEWMVTAASSIATLHLNQREGPATNFYFRRALQHAVNRDELNLGVFEGQATIGHISIAPGFTGRPAEGSYMTIEHNLDLAREYLERSGYNGEEFRITTVSGTANELAAQILQGQLLELGINAQVIAVDAASFFAMGDAGDYHANLRAQGVSLLDADGLFFMFHSDHIIRDGLTDTGRANPDLDALISRGRVETDPAVRQQIYLEAVNLVTELAIAIPLYYEVNAVAFNRQLNGVHPHALFGLYYFCDWSWN